MKNKCFDFIKEKTCLFNLSNDLNINKNKYTLIKGAVQSGKSRIIYALILYYKYYLEENIIILLRNFTNDYEQFYRGLLLFIKEFNDFIQHDNQINIHYLGKVCKNKKGFQLKNHEKILYDFKHDNSIFICLSNHDHLLKLNKCIELSNDINYSIIIDEIDQIFYSNGKLFQPLLHQLIENSNKVFGISATLYEPFQDIDEKFKLSNIWYLLPPINYKGILDINYVYINDINKKLQKEDSQNFLKWDLDLNNFLNKYKQYEPIENHPFIALIKTERLIANQDLLLSKIKEKYKDNYTIIIYNGTFLKLYSPHLINIKIKLPNSRKKENPKSTNENHIFNNCCVQDVLQYLKDNGGVDVFKRILIIGHGMIGRGINIVSADFKWHLTHMFYRPCKTSSIPVLIQSMRLCGIYNDLVPLTCYIEKNVHENLYKGYQLQEDIFFRLENNKNKDLNFNKWIEKELFYIEKIPKNKVSKHQKFLGNVTKNINDNGMSFNDFNYKKDDVINKDEFYKKDIFNLDKEELYRLINDNDGMFKKWASEINNSNISSFMKEGLDPLKEYSKNEINELTTEYNVKLNHLMNASFGKKKSKHYGLIIIKIGNYFKLHPNLLEAFNKYF